MSKSDSDEERVDLLYGSRSHPILWGMWRQELKQLFTSLSSTVKSRERMCMYLFASASALCSNIVEDSLNREWCHPQWLGLPFLMTHSAWVFHSYSLLQFLTDRTTDVSDPGTSLSQAFFTGCSRLCVLVDILYQPPRQSLWVPVPMKLTRNSSDCLETLGFDGKCTLNNGLP